MEPIPEVDLIPLMELIPVVEPIPFIDMIPTLMIPIPTYPHCSKGDSDSDSKNNWNHNTSSRNQQHIFVDGPSSADPFYPSGEFPIPPLSLCLAFAFVILLCCLSEIQ